MLFQVIVKAQRVNSVAGKADSSDSCWMSTLGITGESFQARHLNFWKFPFLVQFSCSVMFDALQPHGLQHSRLSCPSLSPGACSNSCPLCQWCHPTISSSVATFSSCPQSLPESWSFPVSQLFASGGQSIEVSASTSVPPMNTQDWSPLGWTGWISLQSKGLSRVFSNTKVQKRQFFSAQLFL